MGDLLERAVAYLLGTLAPAATALDAPTPCAAWDVRALLEHVADGLAALVEAGGGEVSLTPEWPQEDVVTAVRRSAVEAVGAWQTGPPVVAVGGIPVPRAVVSSAGAVEVAAHAWDLSRAVGGPGLPERLGADLWEVVPLLVDPHDRAGRFAAVRPLWPAASGADRVLAYLGRSPGWRPSVAARLPRVPNR